MTKDIPSLIQLAGGEIVGKIRLQKEVYLLDQMGLRSGFPFEYHHYGPYSDMLAERVEDDAIFGHLNTSTGRRVSDGVPYVIYRADRPGDGDRIDQHLSVDRIRSAIAEMQRSSATVLELAATIHWLAFVEGFRNWSDELVRRKGAKTQGGRDRQALELLGRLGLSPAA
jgi:uncharacterized protein